MGVQAGAKGSRLPGFHAGYFVMDPATEAVHAIFIFNELPGTALDEAMDDFRHHCRDITTGPAEREQFDVVAKAEA